MVQAVLCCFYILLFVFIIYKSSFFRLPSISPNYTALLFIAKIVAGTILWHLFISYYPISDATVFFDDSKILYDAFWNDPVQFTHLFFGHENSPLLQALQAKMLAWNGTHDAFIVDNSRTLIRLNMLLRFFSFGHFYVHAVIFCFLSFTGFVYLYKLFFPFLRNVYFILLIALFLLPSVLFWSATVLKEGVLFLGLGVLLYHCQCGLKSHYSYKNILGAGLGMMILILVKTYVLLALLPALFANFWIARSSHRYIVIKYMVTYCFLLLALFIVGGISPSLNVASIIQNKQTNFINVAKGGILLRHDSCFVYLDYDQKRSLELYGNKGYKLKKDHTYLSFKQGMRDTVLMKGASDTTTFQMVYAISPATSAFAISRVRPTMVDVLKNIPTAFINTLVIPSLFVLNKPFSSLIVILNIGLLLYILCMSIFFVRRKFPLALTLFCFSFVVLLFSLIGLTTPVLGALVRFRIPGIPFLIIGFALMADEKKLIRFFQMIKVNLFGRSPYSKQ